MQSGMVVAVPVPTRSSQRTKVIGDAIDKALTEARSVTLALCMNGHIHILQFHRKMWDLLFLD